VPAVNAFQAAPGGVGGVGVEVLAVEGLVAVAVAGEWVVKVCSVMVSPGGRCRAVAGPRSPCR
jgi:hypothetical protein